MFNEIPQMLVLGHARQLCKREPSLDVIVRGTTFSMSPLFVLRTVIISAAGMFVTTALGFSEEVLANRSIDSVALQRASLSTVAMKLANSAGVAIGIELLSGQEEKRFDFSASGSTLGTELDNLLRNNDRYQWRQLGNTICVFPKYQAGSSVFDMTIDHFESRNTTSVQMLEELLRVPAIVDFLSKQNAKASTWVVGSVLLQRSSIDLTGFTLREGLNSIVIATKGTGWLAFHQQQKATDHIWFQIW